MLSADPRVISSPRLVPHLSFADKVGSVRLFNLLADWADEPTRKKILVDNPAALFGF